MAVPVAKHDESMESQYGHHSPTFGALANYADFHEAIAKLGFENFIQVDLTEVLGLIHAQPDALLEIKVPTLGFTDPAFDFDLRPWFATPLSLNGFGAGKDKLSSKPFEMKGTDILGNEYPLLFNEKGHLDYDLIASQTPGPLFTTLKYISYIYSASQVLTGEMLTKLPMIAEHHGKLLMLPPQPIHKNFEIDLKVRFEKGIVHQETIYYEPGLDKMYHVNQFDVKANEHEHGLQLSIEVDASAYQTPLPAQLGISIEMPGLSMREGLLRPLQGDEEAFKTTQYLGVSQGLLSKVLDVLIPPKTMAQAFTADKASAWNDFSIDGAFDVFYAHIKDGIGNNSIPLLALSDYFAGAEDIKAQMRALNIEAMTKPDQEMFNDVIQKMYHSEDIAFQLADTIDHMLSIETYYPHAQFNVLTSLNQLPEHLDLTLSLTPIGQSGLAAQVYKVTSEGLIDINDYQPIETPELNQDPFFSDEGLEQAATVGQRYSISSDDILKGAHIIHDFDWQNHDVIDLSPLLEQLGGEILEPHITSARHGDELEIYLEDGSGLGASEKMHVATIVGISGDDDLPSIDQFVEQL